MSTVVGLTPLSPSQSTKEVQINGNFALIEAFSFSVLDVRNTPPTTPSELDTYLVTGSPTGVWSDHANSWAAFINGAWSFLAANARFLFYSNANGSIYHWSGSAWVAVSGVGATGSLAVFGDSAAPTTGAGQYGIYADSGDGGALKLRPPSNGTPKKFLFDDAGRELLTADRTYYLRLDGSDSNDGLSNTSGGAFATIGKARSVIGPLDIGAYNVKLKINDGDYISQGAFDILPPIGSGTFTIEGNLSDRTAVKLGQITLTKSSSCAIRLSFLTIDQTNNCLFLSGGGVRLYISNCKLKNVVSSGYAVTCYVSAQAVLIVEGSLQSEGSIGSGNFMLAVEQGNITINPSITTTFIGSPSYAQVFQANGLGFISLSGSTLSGISGTLYIKDGGGQIRRPDGTFF
jgi:hypothetical protein